MWPVPQSVPHFVYGTGEGVSLDSESCLSIPPQAASVDAFGEVAVR